jgi:hypothetical protein
MNQLIKKKDSGQSDCFYERLEQITSEEFVETVRSVVSDGEILKFEVKKNPSGLIYNIRALVRYESVIGEQRIIFVFEYFPDKKNGRLEYGLGTETLKYFLQWASEC